MITPDYLLSKVMAERAVGKVPFRDVKKRSLQRRFADIFDILPKGVRQGIRLRIKRILETGDTANIFSKSAAPVLAGEFGSIATNNGVLTIRKNSHDKFGEAFIHRDAKGEWHQSEVPDGGNIVLEKASFVTIPDTPADPSDIQARASRGGIKI